MIATFIRFGASVLYFVISNLHQGYERTASYFVLKGMVAHWEKKVRDAEYVENTPQTRENFLDVLMVGDPKRYLPDPPIIHRYDEVVRIALMAQNMTSAFVSNPNLFNDLPPEVRFVEQATFIKGGTALRKFMLQDFCPSENIEPFALREGLRRLEVQLSNLQIDPYSDLRNVVLRLSEAIAIGTPDDATDSPYIPYIANTSKDSPGYFETYTFDHDRQSMVKFLDSAKVIKQGTIGPTDSLMDQIGNEAATLFGFGGGGGTATNNGNTDNAASASTSNSSQSSSTYVYKTPEDRSAGRPHNLGWLSLLGDEEMTAGMPVSDSDNNTGGTKNDDDFESDNWREVIVRQQATTRSF